MQGIGLRRKVMSSNQPTTNILVCVGIAVKHTMYQHKVDVDMLNTVKCVLADVLSVSPSSEQRLNFFLFEHVVLSLKALCSDKGLTLETSANTLFTVFSISTSTLRRYILPNKYAHFSEKCNL